MTQQAKPIITNEVLDVISAIQGIDTFPTLANMYDRVLDACMQKIVVNQYDLEIDDHKAMHMLRTLDMIRRDILTIAKAARDDEDADDEDEDDDTDTDVEDASAAPTD